MTELGARGNAASLENVLKEFDESLNHLGSLCQETRTLVEKLLSSDKNRIHSIQGRVKGREKLASKYSDPSKTYLKLSDVTDLVGLRIITYYEDDMDHVAETIKREFQLDAESVDKTAD